MNFRSINFIGKTGNRRKDMKGNNLNSKKTKQAFEKLRINYRNDRADKRS